MNAGLQSNGISPWATLNGYVELQYSWPWDPLCATIRSVDVAHSLIFTTSLRPSTPFGAQSRPQALAPARQTVEGMWWKEEKDVTGFVSLANVTSQPVQATVQVSDNQANGLAQHTVTISPHGMKTVNLTELPSVTGTEGGIRISYVGSPYDLIINGGVEDEAVGYSAGLAFAAPPVLDSQLPANAKLTQSNSIAELGLMAGAADPMMNFPAATTFTPFSVLRNISNAPMSLTPTIWWMQSGQAHSAQLQPVQLQPYQSQSLNVTQMLGLSGIPNYNGSFNVVFNGNVKPGSLLTTGGSVDQTKNYVFQIVPGGVAESASKSVANWSTANGDDTMITLWNAADEAQDLVLKLFFTGGHYLVPIHLDPRATRMINLSDVVQNAPPDAEGNTIPPTVHQGSAKITGNLADNQYILIAMDAGIYNVRKATCGYVCYTCDGWVYGTNSVTPSPFSVTVDTGGVQMDFTDQWNDGSTHDLSDVATWSGGNVSISSGGFLTGTNGGPGSAQAQDSSEPVYADPCTTEGGSPCPVGTGVGGGTSGNVYDGTPSINNISNQPWPAGSNTSFQVTGSGFGTNPGLTISGTGIDTYSVSQNPAPTDTQFTASVMVDPTAPTQTNSVTITVTNQGMDGQGFIGQGGQSQKGSAKASVLALAAPTPQIWFNGSNVTGQTQNVVVGQQITLSTVSNIPGGLIITGNNWTIPGTIVGGYDGVPASCPSGSVCPPTLTGTSVTIYWAYSANGMQVQYSYCMNNGQCSPTATATFSVSGPTGGSMTSTPYSPTVNVAFLTGCLSPYMPSGPYLIDAVGAEGSTCSKNVTASTYGITFNAPVNYQNSSGGAFSLLQLISTDIVNNTNSGVGLDTQDPYPAGPPTNDSPALYLPSNQNSVTRTFTANMFLMWQSNTEGSIRVPLGYQTWGFGATATCNAGCDTVGNWTSTTSSAGPIGNFEPSSSSQTNAYNNVLIDGFPTWTIVTD